MIYESEQVAALPVVRAVPAQSEPAVPAKKPGLVSLVLFFVAGLIFVAVASVGVGATMGWRPVVIQTGSMEPSIPVGSLVLARPLDASEIATGHVVVMRPPGRAPVTHRVTAVDAEAGLLITRGDANSAPDPVPYQLQDSELVAAYIVPAGGRLFVAATHPAVPTSFAMLAVLIVLLALFPDTSAQVRLAVRNSLRASKNS